MPHAVQILTKAAGKNVCVYSCANLGATLQNNNLAGQKSSIVMRFKETIVDAQFTKNYRPKTKQKICLY